MGEMRGDLVVVVGEMRGDLVVVVGEMRGNCSAPYITILFPSG